MSGALLGFRHRCNLKYVLRTSSGKRNGAAVMVCDRRPFVAAAPSSRLAVCARLHDVARGGRPRWPARPRRCILAASPSIGDWAAPQLQPAGQTTACCS
eukprot:350196-Chlamydomonas_euryale.AAC.1